MKNFVAGSKNVALSISVDDLFDASVLIGEAIDMDLLTNKAIVALTEVVEVGTTIGITARAPHNKKENQDEVVWAVNAMNALVQEQLQAQQNKSEAINMVVIGKGVNITAEQILYAMEEKGLVIGGECETKIGFGVITGFEAKSDGLFVHLDIDGEPKMFMSSAVHSVDSDKEVINEAVHMAASGTDVNEELAQLMQDAKYTIEGQFTEEGEGGEELTEEERFEAQENERNAGRTAWVNNQKAKGAALAGSDAAANIMALAQQLVPQAGKSEVQTKNQTNGGNVQMKTTVQVQGAQGSAAVDRPATGVAGGGAPAKGNTQPSRTSAGAAPRTPASAGARPAAPAASNNNQGGRTSMRVSVGAVAEPKANDGRKKLGLKKDEVVSTARDAWYMNEAAYPNVMNGEAFEAARSNPQLGITDAKMYDAVDYAARFNREAYESDVAVLEIFFGAVSFEFKINKSDTDYGDDTRRNRQEWYCGNIAFIANRFGTGGSWKYTTARKEDTVYLTQEADGFRAATKQEIAAADKNGTKLVSVGGKIWKNKETVYGISMHEEVIAQVMRWARHGWDLINASAVAEEKK